MAKQHITRKQARNSAKVVIAVGYCDLQHVLNYESPTGYNAGVNGWNFDLYQIDYRYAIATGYRGMSAAASHNINEHRELKEALAKLEIESVSPELTREQRHEKLLALFEQYLPC